MSTTLGAIARRLTAIAAVPVLLVAWCLRPVVRFRLCVVGAHRFGHLALEPEMWLTNRALTAQQGRPIQIDLWSLGSRRVQSNHYLADLWSRRLRCPPSWVVGALVRAGEMFPRLALERGNMSIFGPNNALDRIPRFLPSTEPWMVNELTQLRDLGFDPLKRYVALVVRDSAHYISRGEPEHESTNMLNGDINKFRSACEVLVKRGFQVVRLGGPTPQRISGWPGVFDYANSTIRSPRIDTLLALNCQLAISNQTGPDAVVLVGRKPVLYLDVLRLSQFFLGTRLATWVPVTFRDAKTGHPWSLRQLCRTELLFAKDPQAFLDHDVEISKASEHDILTYVSGYFDEIDAGISPDDSDRNRGVQLQSAACGIIEAAMGNWGSNRFGRIVAPPLATWTHANCSWWLADE